MAIARLQAKVGLVGKGAAHAAYIAREGKYAARLERGEKLEATEAGNMPAWAAAQPALFWQAADRHERANGTAYREFELALPRELTPADRAALVRDWVRQEIGERHAYQWAIHNPRAVDGGEQPHAHLMFSERQRDGIDRNPDRYFKRYNAKAPEKGGARKGYGPNAGQTLKAAERVDELKALRGRWADLVNAHLERAGLDERIDMRSYREQGIEREREGRQKPSDWHQGGKATAIEFRQMRAEQEQAAAEFRQAVPVGLVATLEDQRRRLEAIRVEIQAPAVEAPAQIPERAGLHGRNFGTILKAPQEPKETEVQRSERLALEAIDRAPPGTAERLYAFTLRELEQKDQAAATAALEAVRGERQQWDEARTAHQKAEPWMIGRGVWEKAGADLNQAGRSLTRRETAAEWAARPEIIEAAAKAKLAEQMPRFTERAEADKQARLDREAKEQKARIEMAKREKVAKDLERANASVGKDFDLMADKRRFKMFGFHDHSDDWKATPPALRNRIDAYNQLPERERAAEIEKINRDPATREQLKGLMAAREQAIQRQGRSR